MQSILWRNLLLAFAGFTTIGLASAGGPTFTVKCMHTGGPTILPKYGTYYFFLREDQVKGYGCNIPGRPCQITSQNATMVVFQTPGDDPDTMTMDLQTGNIRQTTSAGVQSTFACRQVPNGS
jgi:IPT/TIG domain